VKVVGPKLDPAETARAQVEALGFDRRDVRHIIVTHLDIDHAGGIEDFPEATIHVHAAELEAATARATRKDRERYNVAQWAHGPRWAPFAATGGEPWMGFEAVRDVPGLPPEILLVPVVGHTRGHTAVAVDAGDGWLFHCGDAYFHRTDVEPEIGKAPFGLALFEWFNDADSRSRKGNVTRLRELVKQHPEVRVFCSHDPDELDACRAASPRARVA
jgi:glyoxylase-like metal-dependent hydrolase (beta-lactamase superfamily II)